MTQQRYTAGLKTVLIWATIVTSVVLTGCGSRGTVLSRAPVEDRNASVSTGTATANLPTSTVPVTSATLAPPKPLPGIENAGKPGYYTVKPGDTMIRIGLDSGQNWRDVTRWNGLDNPNIIEVGQVLRVIPPGAIASVVLPAASPSLPAAAPAAGADTTGARPVTSPAPVVATTLPPAGTRTAAVPAVSAPTSAASAASAPATAAPAAAAPVAAAPVAPAPPQSAASAGDDDVAWIWPSAGSVIAGFDEVKNKGLDIAGKLGDPVLAAGDGRVVYAGAGLRGYGNLIILKHNNTYLTAYAHNQTLLVKEDQAVRKGQKIAEVGQSDADRVKLHFEIRRQGKPVDPARYLPAR